MGSASGLRCEACFARSELHCCLPLVGRCTGLGDGMNKKRGVFGGQVTKMSVKGDFVSGRQPSVIYAQLAMIGLDGEKLGCGCACLFSGLHL